ncbi:MAG: LysM peptidoglycan-binding domain-containing protein [Anaerolineae bacterium]
MSNPQLAQFQRLTPDGTPDGDPVPVQYNPTEYTLNKGVQIAEVAIPGLDSPILQFVRGQNETLSLDLFFDTTDQGMGEGATSVTTKTDKLYRLIKMDSDTHAPPVLLFSWGQEFPGRRTYGRSEGTSSQNQQRFGFKCIVESVRQRYTLFSPEGVPLRATLTVTLREYKTLAEQIQELNPHSGDHTRAHVVQRGETLTRIAGEAYGDPAAWRRIAEFNAIADPLALRPGTILEIPPIG